MPVRKALVIAALAIGFIPVSARAQVLDPASVLAQEWTGSEIARNHLAEAMRRLIDAHAALQKRQIETDAYWAKYVAGLHPESPSGK